MAYSASSLPYHVALHEAALDCLSQNSADLTIALMVPLQTDSNEVSRDWCLSIVLTNLIWSGIFRYKKVVSVMCLIFLIR